jgi:hypothetical protein
MFAILTFVTVIVFFLDGGHSSRVGPLLLTGGFLQFFVERFPLSGGLALLRSFQYFIFLLARRPV